MKPTNIPTIIDVAAAAGVSKSTVSLVLQESPLVKAATREAVRKAMGDLGYVYNAAAMPQQQACAQGGHPCQARLQSRQR